MSCVGGELLPSFCYIIEKKEKKGRNDNSANFAKPMHLKTFFDDKYVSKSLIVEYEKIMKERVNE